MASRRRNLTPQGTARGGRAETTVFMEGIGYDMLSPKMKPGDRVIVEYRCIEDSEGRLSISADVIEDRTTKPKPLHRGRKKQLRSAAECVE
jgi:hypothetical protein